MTTQELKQETNETYKSITDRLSDFTARTGFVLNVNIHSSKDANRETVYNCDGYLTDNDE